MFVAQGDVWIVVFFVEQKNGYEVEVWLEFKRVLFRSLFAGCPPPPIRVKMAVVEVWMAPLSKAAKRLVLFSRSRPRFLS